MSMAKYFRVWSAVVAVCVLSGALVAASFLAGSPGSAQDPLVTESYVTEQLDIERQLRKELEARLMRLETQGITGGEDSAMDSQQLVRAIEERLLVLEQVLERSASSGDALEIVSLHAGEAIVGEAGTELILRSGEVTVLASPSGGLADLTVATDLGDGEAIHANHLLLVPRADQRGLLATTDAVLLVRGAFSYVHASDGVDTQGVALPNPQDTDGEPSEQAPDEGTEAIEPMEAIEEIVPSDWGTR